MDEKRIILGIDPGTQIMGYGLLLVENGKPKLVLMGVVETGKYSDHHQKLHVIFTRVQALIDQYKPTEMAIEQPFFGKNVQSMLKLGRAQGVAMAAALSRNLPISEYAPLKIKMALTGNGQAAKEQVAFMLQKLLKIPQQDMLPQLDATDALAAAYCHFLQTKNPISQKPFKSWKDFISQNPKRVKNENRNTVQRPQTD